MVSTQTNMQVHDDLAALLSRNLTFNSEGVQTSSQTAHGKALATDRQASTQPVAYSISQHYHHSAHTANPQPDAAGLLHLTRPSSEPSQSDTLSSEHILRLHGIDSSSLTPSQIQLFRVADAPQRMRLLELWSICPPTRGDDIPSLAWSSTTLEQEEHLARLRLERQRGGRDMGLDEMQSRAQSNQWMQAFHSEIEPYMKTGYEDQVPRDPPSYHPGSPTPSTSAFSDNSTGGKYYTHATDPIYGGPDWIRRQEQERQQQQQQQQHMAMAAQYGAFEQIRRSGATDAMDIM